MATPRTWRPPSSSRRRRWYLAEGATHGRFDLFYLIQNPSSTAGRRARSATCGPSGAPIVKTYTVGAGSRFTIWVDQEDQALRATDVSAEITSTNGVPIIVERSMYLNTLAQGVQGRSQQRRRDGAGD